MLRALLLAALLVVAACASAQAGARDVLLIVEENGASITVIDGERLEAIHRFATKRPVAGPPKFSPDGRFAFFASSDGWIVKYDLQTFVAIDEAHAGRDAHGFAVSGDGRYVAVAGESPPRLIILDGNLRPRKTLTASSRIARVVDATRRKSFVVALQDAPELWEVSYDPKGEPIAEGVVHDFRLKEGTFVEGFLNPRRTKLEQPLDHIGYVPEGSFVVGIQREGRRGQVVQLDVRRAIGAFESIGSPRPGSGAIWSRNEKPLMAIPNAEQSVVTMLDVAEGKIVKQIATDGPSSLVRVHDASRHAWAAVKSRGGASDTLQVIDKQTLEIVAKLTPESGQTVARVEFDRSGRHVWARVDGALIVFDARTLREAKRIGIGNPVH